MTLMVTSPNHSRLMIWLLGEVAREGEMSKAKLQRRLEREQRAIERRLGAAVVPNLAGRCCREPRSATSGPSATGGSRMAGSG